MNVIFTCGGTGGHIYPAIAIADAWKERHPDSNILFIGGEHWIEEKLVPKAGYDLKVLPAYGFERSLKWGSIKHNLKAIKSTSYAVKACKKIIRDFKADVVIGTGGFASFPALMAASQLKIPTCVHESNAVPGLTTKMFAKRADKVLVCFPQCIKHYAEPEKVEVVGMPVNREFIYSHKEECRKELNLDSRPVILSAFGSQGAKLMNQTMAELFELEKEAGYPFQHIHAVGHFGRKWMPELVHSKGIETENNVNIMMQEYIYNMPRVMAAADVVIGRAGSSTCNEIAASGTPCILIPSPNVTANHQENNARALEEKGAAVVVLEKDCTAQTIMEKIQELLEDKARYKQMRKALHGLAVPDSAERVCDIMEKIVDQKALR